MFVWLDLHRKKFTVHRAGVDCRAALKAKVTPVLCLRGVTGLWLREGGEGFKDMIVGDGSNAPGSADSCLVGVS